MFLQWVTRLISKLYKIVLKATPHDFGSDFWIILIPTPHPIITHDCIYIQLLLSGSATHPHDTHYPDIKCDCIYIYSSGTVTCPHPTIITCGCIDMYSCFRDMQPTSGTYY